MIDHDSVKKDKLNSNIIIRFDVFQINYTESLLMIAFLSQKIHQLLRFVNFKPRLPDVRL